MLGKSGFVLDTQVNPTIQSPHSGTVVLRPKGTPGFGVGFVVGPLSWNRVMNNLTVYVPTRHRSVFLDLFWDEPPASLSSSVWCVVSIG